MSAPARSFTFWVTSDIFEAPSCAGATVAFGLPPQPHAATGTTASICLPSSAMLACAALVSISTTILTDSDFAAATGSNEVVGMTSSAVPSATVPSSFIVYSERSHLYSLSRYTVKITVFDSG